MGKKLLEPSNGSKWELRREDNACTQIWKYDRTKNKNGPVSVETIWKTWILDEWDNKRKVSPDEDEGSGVRGKSRSVNKFF